MTDTDVEAAAKLAVHDRRAARLLIGAQQTETVTRARIAAADAAAERELRQAEQRQRLAAADRTARAREAEQAEARRQARRAQEARDHQERATRRRARRTAVLDRLRERADDVYAAGIYLLAVGGAVYGQITAATARGWPLLAGVVIAAAIEGLALVMALTAQRMRLAGEAARTPRALTWLCAATAAAINYLGHVEDSPGGAIVLAVLSAAGIVVWEIRSGATHRAALRARGMLPHPPASFGWRRWWRFLPSTLAAWSVDVRDRVSPRAAHLLQVAATERRDRIVAGEREQVRRLARRAVRAAIRRGDTGAVLTSLTWLAAHGTLRPVPALPAPDQTPPVQDRTAAETVGTAPSQDRTSPDLPIRCYPGCRTGPDRTATPDPTDVDRDCGPDDRGPDHAGPDDGGPGPGGDTTAGPVAALGDGSDGPAPSTPPPDPSPVRSRRPSTERSLTAPSNPTPPARTRPPTTHAGTGPRTTPDVSDLLPAGLRVRDRLAAHGVPLSRSVLIKGLRADQVPVSTDRATALLAALRADPGAPAPPQRSGR